MKTVLTVNSTGRKNRKAMGRKHALLFLVIATLFGMIAALSSSYALIGIKEGDSPASFTLNDLNGSPVNVGSHFGTKPVILVFWELAMSKSFLDYSMDELKFLNDFYGKYHDTSGLEIFAIYTPEEEGDVPQSEIDRVSNLIKVNKIKFPVLIDSGFELFREYGVIALPSTIMIDGSGKIQFIYPSFPLAAQKLFVDRIMVLIGLAEATGEKEAGKKKGPDSQSVILYNYALHMYKKGLMEQALSPLNKSIEMDPEFPWTHNLMGIILWKSGNFEGALAEFRQAITIDQKNVPAHFNYGILLFESENYEEAEKHFRTVISFDTAMAEAHYVLGLLSIRTNRENEAIHELGTALELFEKRKASEVYELSVPSAFHRISTIYTLSVLYRKKGETEKALGLLQKAAEIALGHDMKASKEEMNLSKDLMIYE